MAQRIGAKVTEVSASHAVFMTQPDVVADVIDQAARNATVLAEQDMVAQGNRPEQPVTVGAGPRHYPDFTYLLLRFVPRFVTVSRPQIWIMKHRATRSALQFVAGRAKLKLSDSASVTASVGIGPRDEGAGFALDIALEVDLPGMAPAVADDLMQQAHLACPYSHLARQGAAVRLSLR